MTAADETPYRALLDDLADEQADLGALLRDLPSSAWDRPTPAVGWAVRDQVYHLMHYDEVAVVAINDPTELRRIRDVALADPDAYEAEHLRSAAELSPGDLLERWVRGSRELVRCLRSIAGAARIDWFGPPMSAMSFATARLMEVWAHGQDIAEALGIERAPTDRVQHVAHLGVITRAWSYRVRGIQAPAIDVRVELTAPTGKEWSWGPVDAAELITGPALDFALVVTQRRLIRNTQLQVTGDSAREWMTLAQAFAGRPGLGASSRTVSAS